MVKAWGGTILQLCITIIVAKRNEINNTITIITFSHSELCSYFIRLNSTKR